MSDNTDIAFVISYGGNFDTVNGHTFYIGGKIYFIHTAAANLFRGINEAAIVDMNRQRIWYKLPHDNMQQLKILCDGSSNFTNMCIAAGCTKNVEIYLEHEDVHVEPFDDAERVDHDGPERDEDDGAKIDEDDETEKDEDNEIERHEDDEAENASVGDDCEERVNARYPQEECVEGIVAGFVDEEEDNEAYRNTPPASDDEEEDNAQPYERYRKGSGELKVMLVFESIKAFKEAVLENSLKEERNVKYTRWGYDRCESKCAVKGKKPCAWRVYCSYEDSMGLYMIKTHQGHHSCTRDGYCRLLTERVIAEMFVNEIINNPGFKPKANQESIQERHNLTVTHDICRKAKRKALEMQLIYSYSKNHRFQSICSI